MTRNHWTQLQLDKLRALYPNIRTEDIAREIGRPLYSIYNKAQALGLKKSAEFLASPASGRTNGKQGTGTRFQKGMSPWNAGLKGLQYEASKATQFKSGFMPHNTLPIGSYRITKDGTLQRKISNRKGSNSMRWRGVHELIWIEKNGAIPEKHIVVFKPGMRTNILEEITIEKVECISFAENMRRNTRHNLPQELNQVIQLRAVLTRQINKRRKTNEPAQDN